jgi:hypothetical protein
LTREVPERLKRIVVGEEKRTWEVRGLKVLVSDY